MVDWTAPAEIAREAAAFNNFMHAIIGLYMWEFFNSLDFEWQIMTGQKRFRWPLCFYFAGRYTLFGALIGILVALNSKTEINCQALYTFNQFMGDAAVGFASVNLALRVIAIYKSDKRVMAFLIVVILGHWGCIFGGISLTATFVPGQGCVITQTNTKMISAVFIYSMGFDLLVLVLSALKLAFPFRERSQLVRLLFADGLIYFIIAFFANATAMTFMILDLNPIMSIIFNVPACVASTIVASRTVRRLTNFVNNGPEMFNSNTAPSHSNGGSGPMRPATGAFNTRTMPSDGVHVRMETFAHADAASAISDSPVKTRDFIVDDDLEHGHEAKY